MSDLFDLTGKTALITGGGTGLGREFANVLGEHGARIILAARRMEKLEGVVSELRAAGVVADAVSMDVSDGASVKAAFEQINTLSVPDILVNNAGVVDGHGMLDLDEEDWDTVLNTNLKGAWLVAKAAVQGMIDGGKSAGVVVNISSVMAVCAQKGTGPYAASKAGLTQLTKTMALEWAKFGVRVNAIAPGYFATDMVDDFLETPLGQSMKKRIPLRRMGIANELRAPLLLLASEGSSYMTGSVITVDGGHSMPQTI